MSDFTELNGIKAKDTELRSGIDTLRTTVLSNTIKPLTINKEGTYTADPTTGTYGYSPVTVEFPEWEPLEDGYSNFWFELDSNTLSPWLNFSAKNNDAVIDWGDGSGEVALDTLTPTHTYSKAGKYVVKVKGITGIAAQLVPPLTTEKSYYVQSLKYVELNNDVDSLANSAFDGCAGLIRVVGNVSSIGAYCFRYAGSMKKYELTGATSIPTGLFLYAVSLNSVSLTGVETIGASAFYICRALTEIVIPSTCTSIGANAFDYNSSLSSVHVQATTPPTVGTGAFTGLASNYVIYVPTGTLSAYQSAWSEYADHIVEEGQSLSKAQLRAIEEEQKKSDNGEEMR